MPLENGKSKWSKRLSDEDANWMRQSFENEKREEEMDTFCKIFGV